MVLPVEKERLKAWTSGMLKAITARFEEVKGMQEGHPEYPVAKGLAIHLGLYLGKVQRLISLMSEEVDGLMWP